MKDINDIIDQFIRDALERIRNLPGALSFSDRSLQTALIAVAITLTSFLFVDIFYKGVALWFVGQTAGGAKHILNVIPVNAGGAPEDYQVISQRNLFMTTLTPILDKTAVLPSEEYTAYDLKGTIAVSESMGYAVVEEKGKGKQKLYRLGDMIGSARLIRVTRSTAVLENAGRELLMKIKETSTENLPGRSPRPPGMEVSLSRKEMTDRLGDLKNIMSQAVVRPFLNESGAQQGFIISNIVQGSLYERMGIKNGDVIVNINDQKINSADDVLQLVNVMQSGGSLAVNIIRNGKNELINYSFH